MPRRPAGRLAVVVLPGGLVGHQRRQLDLDLRLGQDVGDALVAADRHIPNPSGARVVRRLGQRIPADSNADRGANDSFGVQPVEHVRESLVFITDQSVAGQAQVVEEEGELSFRERLELDADQMAGVSKRLVG